MAMNRRPQNVKHAVRKGSVTSRAVRHRQVPPGAGRTLFDRRVRAMPPEHRTGCLAARHTSYINQLPASSATAGAAARHVLPSALPGSEGMAGRAPPAPARVRCCAPGREDLAVLAQNPHGAADDRAACPSGGREIVRCPGRLVLLRHDEALLHLRPYRHYPPGSPCGQRTLPAASEASELRH